MIKKIIKIFFTFFVFCFVSSASFAATEIHDTEIENVLTGLLNPLANAANIPSGRLKIHIIADDDFNAFVRSGEEVYIYTGLLKQIKSAGALQAVIAHELGHSIGGHLVQMADRMDAEMKRAMIVQALGIGLLVAGGDPSMGAGIMVGSGGLMQSGMLSFSRDEERMADDLGVDLMIRAGLNPNGFIDVFSQMQDTNEIAESKINPNNINHPLTAERLKNVKDKISKLDKKYEQNKVENINYELVRAKLIGYIDNFERIKTMYPNSDKSDAAIYARAIANMRGGNLDVAKVGVGTLISRYPNNPYFYELLGDIEYQYGHYYTSASAYEKSISLSNNAPQIQTALALVLTERKNPGDNDKAISLCKAAILLDAQPLPYWILARIYTDGKSDWALAEYYNLMGQKKQTEKYAKKAQSCLPKDSPEYIKSGDLLN